MDRNELIALLKEIVTLETKTSSEYTGGDLMYEHVTTVNLVVDGEIISSVTV